MPPDFLEDEDDVAAGGELAFSTYDSLGDFFASSRRRRVDRADGDETWRAPAPGDLFVERVRRDSIPERDFSRLGLVVAVGRHQATGAALGPVCVVWSPWGPGTDVQPAGC